MNKDKKLKNLFDGEKYFIILYQIGNSFGSKSDFESK